MNEKSITGIGIGSASLILIFTVLCLVFFSLISYTAANNEYLLARAQADMTTAYYNAQALANNKFDEIISQEDRPEIIEITVPVTDEKEIYIKLILEDNEYKTITNKMRDTGVWIADMTLPVWQGD